MFVGGVMNVLWIAAVAILEVVLGEETAWHVLTLGSPLVQCQCETDFRSKPLLWLSRVIVASMVDAGYFGSTLAAD